MMTSAYLLEEAMSSKDDVSSKLQYIQQSTRSARAGSVMMTSAVMSSQSVVVKKRRSWISDDEVCSDVSNQQRATVQPAVDSADALCDGNNQQSQDDVPVASYSAPSRKLQCTQSQDTVFCISSRRKSRRKKSRRSEELQPGAKNPVAAVEDTTSSEAVDELDYEDSLKLDVNC
ncbi:hypothetical protein F511_44376 [Dorcoceras hygrometricum]|uniref:Uncharacterized protein n=1 Tax=Dorcoceras hygrometricum TaxID=472368 RepID=A0A2Z7BKU3_9LAMI|nr:hypothetical protein F511_44376 [Dorcoceras hygrometricum]